ncbi:MAG: zinc ribbon domain-containing protein [Ideonella sp.]|jgi:putative FmdB family regulatory protein|nr:zinc ribbon domain-containing protein [Ideonella sp.]
MPIYAYKCDSCGHAQDVLQKISDAPLTDCPACGQPTLRKQVTAAGFQLKGSGWYVTDFRGTDKAGGKAGEKAGDAAVEKAGDKAAQPAESAPAASGATAGATAAPAPAASTAPAAAPAAPSSP